MPSDPTVIHRHEPATLGLSLAYLREFHRTLWAPLCMHVVVNGLATGGALAALDA